MLDVPGCSREGGKWGVGRKRMTGNADGKPGCYEVCLSHSAGLLLNNKEQLDSIYFLNNNFGVTFKG